jgi:hypothetical protein
MMDMLIYDCLPIAQHEYMVKETIARLVSEMHRPFPYCGIGTTPFANEYITLLHAISQLPVKWSNRSSPPGLSP